MAEWVQGEGQARPAAPWSWEQGTGSVVGGHFRALPFPREPVPFQPTLQLAGSVWPPPGVLEPPSVFLLLRRTAQHPESRCAGPCHLPGLSPQLWGEGGVAACRGQGGPSSHGARDAHVTPGHGSLYPHLQSPAPRPSLPRTSLSRPSLSVPLCPSPLCPGPLCPGPLPLSLSVWALSVQALSLSGPSQGNTSHFLSPGSRLPARVDALGPWVSAE